jgi:signal transduction histidine kinase
LGLASAVAGTAMAVGQSPFPLWVWIPAQLVGVCFTAAGVLTWRADPQNRTGMLMVAVGITWYLGDLQASDNPVLFGMGFCLYHLTAVVFAHLLLALPDGRLQRSYRKAVIGWVYLSTCGIQAVRFGVEYPPQPQGWGDPSAIYSAWSTVGSVAAICSTIAVGSLVVHRWRTTDSSVRQAYIAALITIGITTLVTFCAVLVAVTDASLRIQQMLMFAYLLCLIAMPIAIRSGVLRSYMAKLTTENAWLQAAKAKYIDDAAASRALVLSAADSERKRIQRDLHDGAQHQLLSIAMLIDSAVAKGDVKEHGARESLTLARDYLQQTARELRDLAHGIYPAALTEQGLAAGVEMLAERSPVPITWCIPDRRWPPRIENAMYFIISECLANVYKHARANVVTVAVSVSQKQVLLTVEDDGVGGADLDRGTGLRGLAERAAAVNGKLWINSVASGGTQIVAELSCE